MSLEKDSLREEAKRKRALLSLDKEERARICDLFFEHIPLPQGSIIAAYWPTEREMDAHILIDALLEKGFTVVLPVIHKDDKQMNFARYEHGCDMTEWAHGIYQPVVNEQTQYINPDVVIVPLLAFDRRGYRLGYGGGYYDVTLSHLQKTKECRAVGIAYAEQACLFNLPKEDHDVPMDWVITEQYARNFT